MTGFAVVSEVMRSGGLATPESRPRPALAAYADTITPNLALIESGADSCRWLTSGSDLSFPSSVPLTDAPTWVSIYTTGAPSPLVSLWDLRSGYQQSIYSLDGGPQGGATDSDCSVTFTDLQVLAAQTSGMMEPGRVVIAYRRTGGSCSNAGAGINQMVGVQQITASGGRSGVVMPAQRVGAWDQGFVAIGLDTATSATLQYRPELTATGSQFNVMVTGAAAALEPIDVAGASVAVRATGGTLVVEQSGSTIITRPLSSGSNIVVFDPFLRWSTVVTTLPPTTPVAFTELSNPRRAVVGWVGPTDTLELRWLEGADGGLLP